VNINFSEHLITWYLDNKRDLPWRNTKDPYQIWLSEIILQQTQVKQGLPYYEKFIETYEDVYALANAPEDEIMKLWQGLGYYSRARNLHFTAKTVVNSYDGKFPKTYKGLLKLKGVGEYTAAAIASFAYGEAVPVVDGNVYRVLSRVFGLDTPVNSTEGQKVFKSKAEHLLDKNQPALNNQAIMEFGALLCRPKSPDCMFCTLNTNCVAYQQNKIKELPVKLKKLKRKKRYFNYLVFQSNKNKWILQQRLKKDIWQKLFEFPLIETDSSVKNSSDFSHELFEILDISKGINFKKINSKTYKHVLSHQDIFTDFWLIEVNDNLEKTIPEQYYAVDSKSIRKFAVPILIDNFLKEHILEN
jgi:A/G-specific adenine glycosylase